MIIDTHAHLYGKGFKAFSPRHSDTVAKRMAEIGIGFETVVDFFLTMMNRAGVDKVLVYANPNEGVAEMVKAQRDRFILFANLDPKYAKAAAEGLEYCVTSLGFRGASEQAPAGKHFYPDDFELLDPLYKKAVDLGVPISWDLETSFPVTQMNSRSAFSGIHRLQEVCFKYPELKQIICHLGRLENYRHTLSAFSGYENVCFDLSDISGDFLLRYMPPVWVADGQSRFISYIYPELVAKAPPDHKETMMKVKNEAAKVFREAANIAPGRIMYGSNAPFFGKMDFEMEICREAFGHDKKLLEHVLGENARKFLKL